MSTTRSFWSLGLAMVATLVLAFALAALWGRSAAAADATLRIDPPTQQVAAGSQFPVSVIQNASVPTFGTQTDVRFDPSKLQIVSVQKGAALAGSSFFVGVAPQTLADAINEANTTGTLRNLAVSYNPGAGTIPAGDVTLLLHHDGGEARRQWFVRYCARSGGDTGCRFQ